MGMIKYKMKLFCLSVVLIAGVMCTPVFAQVSFGRSELFNENWLFYLGDDSTAAATTFDDSKWRQLDLPHDWSIEGKLSPSLASCTGYLPGGVAWYRKHFNVSVSASEKLFIYFEGIYNRSSVYLNGHLLGYRPNGYVSFMYDLTPYLVDGANIISVRVDHSRSADSRWYTGSGIYRDTYLIQSSQIHLAQWGTSYELTELSGDKAVVAVNYSVFSEIPVKEKLEVLVSLSDPSGKQVAKGKSGINVNSGKISNSSLSIKLLRPHLWSIDDPYLYTVHIQLLRGGSPIDDCIISAGLRTIQFDPDRGFFLNGKNMKLKGVCLHHDAGVLGSVVPEEVWERRLGNLKSMGVNAIRMAHNPQAPVLYTLCDRLGLMIIDEISDEWEFPKRKWIEGWNIGTPGFQGSYDFFEEWIEQDITDMVLRDRNHPSVILWSIGNEVDYPNDPYSHPVLDGSAINQPMFGGYRPEAPDARRIGLIAKRLAAKVRSIDTSRPVTGALAGVIMSNETEYPGAIDVVGYNYTEDRYDMDHEKYPGRVIYGSETSVGYRQWKAVLDRDFISGQFLWTGTDYLGESGRWPSRGLYTGLLDLGSFRKPRGWFRASLWSDNPVTYIGTYPSPAGRNARFLSIDAWDTWNYEEGQMIKVVCYTNAPFARLLLNEKIVGEKIAYDQESGVIGWDIPFYPGELTAEGCDANGNIQSRYTIQTTGRPYALRVSADKTVFTHERSVVHLTVEILDEAGRVVNLGDNDITCTVAGPARLLGLEASDNTDMTNYSDNHQRAFRGRVLAYIAAARGPGDVTVRFSSPLLKGTEIVIKNDTK